MQLMTLAEVHVKWSVMHFFRRVQLKAFFHDKDDDSNTSNNYTFETLQIRKSKWTLPEGQFASFDFSIKKCRHDINKLNFNRSTKFSNLSSEERSALKRHCYQSGRLGRRFSCLADRRPFWHFFLSKVDKDLTSINQDTVKNTMNELIAKQGLPASAKKSHHNHSKNFLHLLFTENSQT